MTTIKIPDMESVKKIFEVESEITQIELQHICDGCTELILGHDKKPFCVLEVLGGKCIKEYYQDKDDYLIYQDDELNEIRQKRNSSMAE